MSDEKTVKHFANKTRECRAFLGLTIKELSERSGLTQAAISQIENGLRVPSLPSALKLSRGLGMKLSRLLGEDADVKP